MTGRIHPSALVHPGARLADGRRGRPVLGRRRARGDRARAAGSARTWCSTAALRIGRRNRIFHFASIGAPPQDKKYAGEPTSGRDRRRQHDPRVRDDQPRHGAGRRRHAHRQRQLDHGLRALRARLPDRQQDDLRQLHCQLAGHVIVGDWAIFGATTLVHQFVHIGAHAFTGMGTYLPQDLPPYVMAAGNMAKPYGINSEGLQAPRLLRGDDPGAQARLPDALPQRAAARRGASGSSRPGARAVAEVEPILEFLAAVSGASSASG